MNELLTKLAELNQQEFFIEMADHLSSEDYKLLHEIHEQKTALIKELKDNYDIDYYKTVREG